MTGNHRRTTFVKGGGVRIKVEFKKWISKCWPFVTEDGGSIDTLHYKLGVGDFKCED